MKPQRLFVFCWLVAVLAVFNADGRIDLFIGRYCYHNVD